MCGPPPSTLAVVVSFCFVFLLVLTLTGLTIMASTSAQSGPKASDHGRNQTRSGMKAIDMQHVYEKDLTVVVEMEGIEEMAPMVLIKGARE